jgi:serine protein kinase
MFAVLSRLEESKDKTVDKIKKMRLYNKEDVEGLSPKDGARLRKESNSEGMDGISPRYIVNRLVTTSVRGAEEKGKQRYITPVDVLRALKDGLSTSSKFKPEERAKYDEIFGLTKREYDEIAQNEVQKAFFVSFEDEAKALVENYLDNVEAYLEKTKLVDKITNEEVNPDEKLMRAVETQIGIHESSKDSFRNEVMRKAAAALRRGEKFRYDQHANLRKAIEKQLFEEKRDVIKMTITTRSKQDAEQLKRINQVVNTLCEKHGYIPESANELLEYVSSIMNREKGS